MLTVQIPPSFRSTSVRMALIVAAVTAALAGCSSAPKFRDLEGDIVRPLPGLGRIYFYNDQAASQSLVTPRIHFNGRSIGACQPATTFFIDVTPDRYEAHASNKTAHDSGMKEPNVAIAVAAGGESFVRCRISRGMPIGKSGAFFGDGVRDVVAGEKGLTDIRKLGFSGSAVQLSKGEVTP